MVGAEDCGSLDQALAFQSLDCDGDAEAVGQTGQVVDELERALRRVERIADQTLVDLDLVEGDAVHAQQRTVARTEVVLDDGEAGLPELRESRVALFEVDGFVRFQNFQA